MVAMLGISGGITVWCMLIYMEESPNPIPNPDNIGTEFHFLKMGISGDIDSFPDC